MSKEFYKMSLLADEGGLVVITDIFVSIHETPCFHYCINARDKGFFNSALIRIGETNLQYAKRRGIKVRKVCKNGSRIAFETEKQALDNLRMLKNKQINHLSRQIEFNKEFLKKCDSIDDLLPNYSSDVCVYRTVPDTRVLVSEYYCFDI